MNKENRSRRVRLISVILTLALVIGLFPLKPVKADNGDITENDLKVTYHTVSAWGEYTQVEVTVENRGGSPTTDWQIQFEYDDVTTISSIWNAVAAPSDMSALNLITVSNETYNAKIAPNRKVTYTYDELYRLISETIETAEGTSIIIYEYDSNSNRISMNKNGIVTQYVYNEINQLIQAGTVLYTYDDAGNLVAQSENGILKALYEYDSRNHMVRAQIFTETDTVEETYTYNYLGDRISKTSNGITYYYTLDYSSGLPNNLVVAKDNDSTFYVRGLSLISCKSDVNSIYYLQDGIGTVRTITDEFGIIEDEYHFDSFGNMYSHIGNNDNEYGFQGEQRDNSGLYYLRSRYMNPQTGTFTSMDTYSGCLDDPQSINRYLFANSNPVLFCDPNGHAARGIPMSKEEAYGVCAIMIMLAGVLNVNTKNNGMLFCQGVDLISALEMNIEFGLYLIKFIIQSVEICAGTVGTIVFRQCWSTIHEIRSDVYLHIQLGAMIASLMFRTYEHSYELHHIVAQTEKQAQIGRDYLAKAEMTTSDPSNLVSLSTRMHRYVHSPVYYAYVNSQVLLAYYIGGPDLFCKQESIRGTLEGIAAELTVMDFLLFMTISGPSE